jgi:hypothetical protein
VTIARLRGGSNGRSAERLRFVEPIARCGELGGIGRGGLVAKRRVGSGGVVVGHPDGNNAADVVKTEKQRLVEELVARSSWN